MSFDPRDAARRIDAEFDAIEDEIVARQGGIYSEQVRLIEERRRRAHARATLAAVKPSGFDRVQRWFQKL